MIQDLYVSSNMIGGWVLLTDAYRMATALARFQPSAQPWSSKSKSSGCGTACMALRHWIHYQQSSLQSDTSQPAHNSIGIPIRLLAASPEAGPARPGHARWIMDVLRPILAAVRISGLAAEFWCRNRARRLPAHCKRVNVTVAPRSYCIFHTNAAPAARSSATLVLEYSAASVTTRVYNRTTHRLLHSI